MICYDIIYVILCAVLRDTFSPWARAPSVQNCFLRLNMIFCCRILLHIWKINSQVAQIWLKCHSAKKRGRPTKNDKKYVFGGKSTINNSNKYFNATSRSWRSVSGEPTIPTQAPQKPRKIPLYKKTNWEGLKGHMTDFHNRLSEEDKYTGSPNSLWVRFRTVLKTGIGKYVPNAPRVSAIGTPGCLGTWR